MKVGVITSYVSRNAGGLYFSVRHLSRTVQSLGHRVQVYAYNDAYTEIDIQEWSDLDVRLMNARNICGVHFGASAFNLLKKYDADVSHVHGLWLMSSKDHYRWYKESRKPYLIAPRGMLDPWALNNSWWKKKLIGALFENTHLRSAGCMHALCDSEMQSMRAYGLKSPVAVIPNGIELPDLNDSAGPSIWPEEDRQALLFIGRIHPKKGLPLLLDAWSELKKENPRYAREWFLAIAGWSEVGHVDELKQQSEKLGIQHDVRFLGSLYGEEKDVALRFASAYILPSYSEGIPMSVLEAWSYKLPSLITPQCNIPAGFTADATLRINTTVSSIRDGLRDLFTMSVSDRTRLGERAYDLVDMQFAWVQIGKQMTAVYNWMLGGGEAPECVNFYE